MNFPFFKKPPAKTRSASDFMLNASESERRRMFLDAIDRSIAAQLEVVEKAERMQRQRDYSDKR